MPVIDYNVSWMLYNLYLALLALVFGYLALLGWKWFKYIFGLLWLLYLPNTIYIFTDLEHLVYELHQVFFPFSFFLFLQYFIFEIVGITVFILALVPFEKLVHSMPKYKHRFTLLMILFNFLIAFGMVLGRVERVNSWELFTAPIKVLNASVNIMTSWELIGLTILFGLLCNFIYFLFRDSIIKLFRKFFYLLD